MPDFNPDCRVEGCENESVDKSGLCKKHKATATNEWPDVIGSGGKAPSEPQEWTGSIGGLITDANREPIAVALDIENAKAIADAHNAALKALEDSIDAQWSEGIRKLKADHTQRMNSVQEWYSRQLKAEREKSQERLNEYIESANEALDAEREKLTEACDFNERLSKVNDRLRTEAAAERERRKPLVETAGKLARLLRDAYWAQCPIDVAKAADKLLAALAKVKQ